MMESFFEEIMESFMNLIQDHVRVFSIWAQEHGIPANEQFMLTMCSTMFFVFIGMTATSVLKFFLPAPKKPPNQAQPQDTAVNESHLRPKLHLTTAYILFCTLGLFGAHHFYLHKIMQGILHGVTFGFFGVGMVTDFFAMPQYVKEYNARCHPTAPYCQQSSMKLFIKKFLQFFLIFGVGGYISLFHVPRTLARFNIIDAKAFTGGMETDPYELLEIGRWATAQEMQTAYRKMARKYHPDKNPDCGKECEDKMADITTAYETVKRMSGNEKKGQNTFSSQFEQALEDWVTVLDYLTREEKENPREKEKRKMDVYRKRVEKIYEQFAPDVVVNIDQLMKANRQHIHKMYYKICTKYGAACHDAYDGSNPEPYE